jgi:hypothetical protein
MSYFENLEVSGCRCSRFPAKDEDGRERRDVREYGDEHRSSDKAVVE